MHTLKRIIKIEDYDEARFRDTINKIEDTYNVIEGDMTIIMKNGVTIHQAVLEVEEEKSD
jgi:hypothetical protein